jgi:hypothetical protein
MKGYRVYDPIANRLQISRDVVFDENMSWDWSASDTPPSEFFSVDYSVRMVMGSQLPGGASPATLTQSTPTTHSTRWALPCVLHQRAALERPANACGVSEEEFTPFSVVQGGPQPWPDGSLEAAQLLAPVQFASPSTEAKETLDLEEEVVEVRYRRVDNILSGLQRAHGGDLLLMADQEPSTFDEAKPHAAWRQAMIEELKSIEENGTWYLTELPSSQRPIGLKWVFKLKKDDVGNVVKHKVCLVAKGYVQHQGVDFEEVFTPVARLESLHVIITIVTHHGWTVHHMDVKSAFLNGELNEEVYVAQPPGFEQRGQEHKVF